MGLIQLVKINTLEDRAPKYVMTSNTIFSIQISQNINGCSALGIKIHINQS